VGRIVKPDSFVDGRRLLRGLVLACWSGFFIWLWVSGEMSRYLGPRTLWVISFGAITLGGAALLHAFTLRTSEKKSLPSTMEVLGAFVLVIPLLAVAIVPSAELGTLAASRKAGGPPLVDELAGSAGVVEDPKFREIAYAEESEDYADAIGVIEGTPVDLVGFVDDSSESPEGTVSLTRFYVSCCAADAVPYTVAVDPNSSEIATPEPDSWVEASGILERRDDRLVLVADGFEVVSEPQDPYLY
jgi:putative membrane protein